MTDRTVLALRPDVLARALWNVSDLMLADRVYFSTDFVNAARAVVVNVTGYPVERDELIAALGDPEPLDWTGDSGDRHRDWRGELLTMHVIVTETLPEPPASDPAGDVGPTMGTGNVADDDEESLVFADESEYMTEIVPSPSPVPSCSGVLADAEADCGEPGPHGPHPLGDEPPVIDRAQLDQWRIHNRVAVGEDRDRIAADEQDAYREDAQRSSTPIVIRPASPDDAAAAVVAGLVPADAEHYADPATAAAWHRYAVGRARSAFKGQEFATPTAAMRALDAWPGRRMLNEGDVAQLAGELLAIPPVPARSRPRPYVRWPLARRSRPRHGLLVGVEQGPVS